MRASTLALAAGRRHSVGLRRGGTAAGINRRGQCAVGDWQDIVAVAAGSTHTLGLRADGTVVSAGNNADGQCDVGSWSEIQVLGA
jgi:alpha-tubulin suppressor-like RCC1 family protein